MARPAVLVDPVKRHPYRHSLVASAPRLTSEGDRWEMGFTWRPETCAEAALWDTSCGASASNTKSADFSEPSPLVQTPITVYTKYECQIGGNLLPDNMRRPTDTLNNGVSKELENEFWTGVSGYSNWSLVNNTPTATGNAVGSTGGILNPGQSVTPGYGLVSLAQAASNCGIGTRGMIHAPVMVAEAWAALNYLDREPNPDAPNDRERDLLVTRGRGDIVIVGAGYAGTGPGGTSPATGSAWAYFTPMVGVRLSEVMFPSTEPETIIDRAKNLGTYLAEMRAATQVDSCCAFATLINVATAFG